MRKKLFSLLIVFMALFTVKVKAATEKINITDVKVIDKSSTITVEDPVLEDNAIKSSVKFNEINDFVIYEVSFENKEAYDYTIDKVFDNNTSSNLSVEYDYSEELLASGTGTLRIKLAYKTKLLNVEKISLDNLSVTMNLTRSDGSKTQVRISNPTTGDNIVKYVFILTISIVGIVLTKKNVKIKNYKVGKLLLILPILILPFAIFAAERFEISIKFSDVEVKGEFEVYDIPVGNSERKITYGQKLGELPENPTKTGYTFDKWVDGDGNTVTEDTVITKPITVVAHYIKSVDSLNISNSNIELTQGNDETINTTNSNEIEETFTYSSNNSNVATVNQNGVVHGVSAGTTTIVITGNTSGQTKEIIVTISALQYTVTFDPTDDGQVTTESISVDEGETINSFPSATPIDNSYQFIGWFDGDDEITAPYTPTGDITLTAHYEQSDSLIRYTDSDNNGTINLGDYVKIENDGFWVISEPADGKIKLLAEYNLNSSSRQESSSDYVRPRFSYSNYWWVNGDWDSSNYTMYSRAKYYVYRTNTGADTANDIKIYINNYKDYLINLEANVEDVRLMSYEEAVGTVCTSSSNSCLTYIANQSYWLGTAYHAGSVWSIIIGNHRLYNASYNANMGVRPLVEIPIYDITFDAQNGEENTTVQIISGSSFQSFPSQPTRNNFTFEGWYTDENYTTEVTADTIPTSSTTYYAKWSAGISYTDNNNDGITSGDYVQIGDDGFWVIGTEGTNTKLLAQYNLNSSSRQESSSNYVIPTFSGSNYWWVNNNWDWDSSNYSQDSQGKYYVYRTNTGADTNNNIKPYMIGYKDYLVEQGLPESIDVRLMSYEEAAGTGCKAYGQSEYQNSCPTYVANQTYWLGSASDSYDVWSVSGGNRYLSSYLSNAGVRPVIIVSTSLISMP